MQVQRYGRVLRRNDILKAELLKNVAADRLADALAQWERSEQLLGPSFESFFSHVFSIYGQAETKIIAGVRRAVADRHFRVLPLTRRGWVSGSDSFVSSLLTETGLFNAAGDLGFSFGGFASLEAIVSLKPDLIVVSQAGDYAGDDGQAFLLHPALARFYPPARRIVIPERLTECGGVMLADALDVLARELKRVER